ncbi:MAG: chorismate synthase [Clostridiales bacterium]|nr:chorismate synthase [Clostridiales bacterium]
MIGTNLKLTLFGESHGKGVGCTLDGFPPGYEFDEDLIQLDLDRRKPGSSSLSTLRKEDDVVKMISGVFNGKTTGAPITFYFMNEDTKSEDYEPFIMRASHADYTAYMKYEGFNDYRGGGMFSGRLTAPITAAGSLVKHYLRDRYGIWINSFIQQVGDVVETSEFKGKVIWYDELIPVLNEKTGEEIFASIEKARELNDSIGGKVKTVISGLKAGIGEPFFQSLESEISRMIFSIPSVKAIEFGLGTAFASKYGSEVQDQFSIIDNVICTETNYNGGILGGIASGMPLEFTVTIKPTASISITQTTINIDTRSEVDYINRGRHDPSIVSRVPIVIENAVAIVILDMIMQCRRTL